MGNCILLPYVPPASSGGGECCPLIFAETAQYSNVSDIETTLYSDNVPAGTFENVGDLLVVKYDLKVGELATSNTPARMGIINIYFGLNGNNTDTLIATLNANNSTFISEDGGSIEIIHLYMQVTAISSGSFTVQVSYEDSLGIINENMSNNYTTVGSLSLATMIYKMTITAHSDAGNNDKSLSASAYLYPN